jgi:four helix bundle protein
MPKGDDILERLLSHAVRVVQLCDTLPKNRTATHIANQLLRSGTAAAPNYAEARSGESRLDFLHKLGVVRKELNETLVWLEMLRRLEMAPDQTLGPLERETDELCRIISASIRTASGKAANTGS